MMFLKKKTALLVFKAISLLFVCFLLFVFVRILYANEKISWELKKFENEKLLKHEEAYSANTSNKESLFTRIFMMTSEYNMGNMNYDSGSETNLQDEKCYSKYLAYYAYALILGAYINIKRLYKMGPI